jgi:hypothetical protein
MPMSSITQSHHTMKKHIASYANDFDAVTSVIVEFETKYYVSLRDDDSGIYFDQIQIFAVIEDAIMHAKKIANIN